ncbi:hypothetical protein WMY93_026043 [Mugilogobius chulae]|uniref:Uncharacterized protein n=1 Tax=Mugilogobius chulae TaxID=88201 RepID=A0AAW0N8S7_9GOBI
MALETGATGHLTPHLEGVQANSEQLKIPLARTLRSGRSSRWLEVMQDGDMKYIPCKKYHYSRFCDVNKIKKELLPAFAVLSGNDHSKTLQPTDPNNQNLATNNK